MNYQTLVERKLEPVGVSGDNIIYICPNPACDDRSGHLSVNYNKNKFNCFKCGLGGSDIRRLLQVLNISIDYDYESLYREVDNSLDEVINMKRKVSQSEILERSKDLQAINYYYHAHVIDSYLSPQACEYLYKRGFNDETIIRLRLAEGRNRYGEKLEFLGREFEGRDYSGRIMIPSLTKDGLTAFYLGRDYTGTKDNKYSNAPQDIAVASEDVWGLDLIEGDLVVICEGVFTANAIDVALNKKIACATYGKSIAEKSSDTDVRVTSQGEKLLNRKFKTYIVFYDKDAWKEAIKTAHYLYERGAFVRVVKIPDNMYGSHADADDMTDDEIKMLIRDSEVYDPFSMSISSLR